MSKNSRYKEGTVVGFVCGSRMFTGEITGVRTDGGGGYLYDIVDERRSAVLGVAENRVCGIDLTGESLSRMGFTEYTDKTNVSPDYGYVDKDGNTACVTLGKVSGEESQACFYCHETRASVDVHVAGYYPGKTHRKLHVHDIQEAAMVCGFEIPYRLWEKRKGK